MALNFENPFQQADFMPTDEELKIYKTKLLESEYELECEHENFSPKKLRAVRSEVYDDLGRNVSLQERRQNNVPWVRVKYISGKLFIPPEKKDILRSLGLI